MNTVLALGYILFGVILGTILTIGLSVWNERREEMAKAEMDNAARIAHATLERIATRRIQEK